MATNKNYQNGKIYSVRNQIDYDIYIGSTCQPLSKRMAWHRACHRNAEKRHYKLYAKMNELGVDKFYIELVEEYPCENSEQLAKKEGEYMRSMGTLNMHTPGRSNKEYHTEYKEQLSKQQKEYYATNLEEVKERQKRYRENNRDKLKTHYKEFREQNKDKIRETKSIKFTCECGSECRYDDKARHFRSKKHQDYI